MIQTDLIDGLDLDGELVGYLREAPLVDVDPRAEDAPRRRRPARLAPQPVLVLGTESRGGRTVQIWITDRYFKSEFVFPLQ